MQRYNEKTKESIKHRAYVFALNVIRCIDVLQRSASTDALASQLVRSATSIGANVIEAQAASSRRDFTNFLTHALKSTNETKFWIGLLRDSGKSSHEDANALLNEATELANMLAASIMTLKGKRVL